MVNVRVRVCFRARLRVIDRLGLELAVGLRLGLGLYIFNFISPKGSKQKT